MRPVKLAAWIAAAAALAAGGWTLKRRLAKPSREGGGRYVAAARGPIEDVVEATGAVMPQNRVEIKPPISGRVERLLVDEGDAVKAGQIVAWMSSSDRAAILDSARAQGPEVLARWQDAYKPTPIIVSLPGTIILRNVVEGQTIDPSTVLFAMSDRLIVTAQVDESDIGRIKPGLPARITLDSFPDRSVEGRVFDVLYEGKNVSNVIQYGVKIRLDKVPDWFRSQMTATVAFVLARKEDALLVPSAAVRDASGVRQVMVAAPEGRPVPREVKTGLESGQMTEILEGLKEGEEVSVRQARYVPQQAVQASPLTASPPRSSGPSGQGAGRRRSGNGNR